MLWDPMENKNIIGRDKWIYKQRMVIISNNEKQILEIKHWNRNTECFLWANQYMGYDWRNK